MVSNQKGSQQFKHSRIAKLKNFLESIQTLKIFAWEKPFIEKIYEERNKESSKLSKFSMIKGILMIFTLSGSSLSIFITIYLYANIVGNLNIGETLLAISCLNLLQFFLPYKLVLGINFISMIKQSIQNVGEVLLMPECTNQNE